MGAKEQMIRILRSRETQRINFSFRGTSSGNVSITPAAFRRVATGLENGELRVVEGRFDEDRAVYSSWSDPLRDYEANTFYLGNSMRSSRNFNGLVVHEAVHAWFDIQRIEIPWIDNEAAGYIAQASYLRYSGYPESRLEMRTPLRMAVMVAGDMASGDVTWLLNELRDSLRNDRRYHSYINTTFTGDG